MTAAKKRTTATKKTPVKRAPAKKASTKPRTTSARVSKANTVKSFKVAPEKETFISLKPSVQTLYWLVIGVFAILFTLWLVSLQAQIYEIYDSIDRNNAVNTVTPQPKN